MSASVAAAANWHSAHRPIGTFQKDACAPADRRPGPPPEWSRAKWVTQREAGRGVIPSRALWQLDAYSWYFPYVNERLRRPDRQRAALVLAEWDRVSRRTGVTYDAIDEEARAQWRPRRGAVTAPA